MLDKKDLRGAAVLFRDLAQLLTEWADDLDQNRKKNDRKPAADDTPAEVSVAEKKSGSVAAPVGSVMPAASAAPAGVAASDEPAVPVAPYTYEAVLEYVGHKVSKGFRPQIVALFSLYGAKRFSQVDPSYYGDLVEAVAGLGADPGGDSHA